MDETPMAGEQKKGSPVTEDSFYRGRVRVRQHREGYRFSVDAPMLADFIAPSDHRALEVGTGCGIISLLLVYRDKYPGIDAVEIQPSLIELARRNLLANGYENRICLVPGDIKELYPRFRGVMEVFSNPPFFPVDRGKPSPTEEICIARSERKLTLGELVSRVSNILGAGGRFYLVLPADRREDLLDIARRSGLYLRRHREVRPYRHRNANRFLVQLSNQPGETLQEPPLVIYRDLNVYSEEMEKILNGQDI